MKAIVGKPVIVFLVALVVFALTATAGRADGTTQRVISERVYFNTEGSSGTGYFPPGAGIFGKTLFQLTGSGGCYSYDTELFSTPPSTIANMGPGHAGSNEKIYLSGSVTVSGHVNVPQSLVDQVLNGDFSNLVGGWSCSVGTKLPVGTTGEEGDEREFAGPRITSQLQGWKPNEWPPEGTYQGGTPAWPYDPNYVSYPVVEPQWDKNNDGVTTTADYDYFVANGGFGAERGGATSPIPYTQRDDPTIMVMDKGQLVPASEGSAWFDHYRIDDNNNFIGTWKTVYFTGTQYRFNNFNSGSSESYHYNGNMDFYCNNFHHQGSNDMLFSATGSVTMAVRDGIVFDGESDFNVGGRPEQLDVVCTGTTVDIGGSANGTAGSFYAPNADLLIEGDGWIYAALIANSVTIGGSRSICYPINYRGPNSGAGGDAGGPGGTPLNPPLRDDWKEIIFTD